MPPQPTACRGANAQLNAEPLPGNREPRPVTHHTQRGVGAVRQRSPLSRRGTTGVELYRHLIDAGRAIPTILVTAYADDDVGPRALKDGVLCYLRKPVDEKHLKRCLLAALRRSERPGD
jgi:CheY-like chemotaxis protein